MVTVLVRGNLSKEEILELLQKIRDIEQHDKERQFFITVDAPNMSKERMFEVFSAVKPPLPFTYFLERTAKT